MAWVGVITNVGQTMLESVMQGTAMNINTVKLGSGSVPQVNMRQQTNLQSYVTTGSLTSDVVETGLRLRILAGPYTTSYTLKEVGIFARLSGESSDSMLALYQEVDDGIVIPDSTTFPDFAYVLYGILAVSNVNNITVTVDASALVSHGEMESAIATAIAAIPTMTGATSSSAGAKGVVPAPSAGDQNKYLKGDGTWGVLDLSGKADKVSGATNGDFAGLDSNGNLTDSGKKASDFAVPSTVITATLSSGSWSSSSPYTQTINNLTGVTSTSNIVVGVAPTITSTQFDAALKGKIVCTAQGNGTITITAYGNKPTSNIPLSVMIVG